ncbi:MAG: CapA family protein [Rhizobiales bacterium]|nr:CapA family protein [Hyphomicrobiales bacterium]
MPASAETLYFSGACTPGERITVAAVGDLLFHKKLQAQAYGKNGSFKRFFTPVLGVLKGADLAYGNLEGPAARGVGPGGRAVKDPGKRLGDVYGAPLKSLAFNYHPSVAADLKQSGFDVLSTANNHSMDRGALGADRTIDTLRKAGMPFTGSRKRGESPKNWHVLTKSKGFTVAWIGCSFSTNGLPDRKKQILHCYKQTDEILAEIRELHENPEVDAVFLTPHWGIENRHRPGERQRTLARKAIEAGATAVFGAHPHVLQPWEKIVTDNNREGLVVYSAGNFISNQRQTAERTGIMAIVELVKTAEGKTKLAAAGYIPTWVVIDNKGHRVTFNNSSKGRTGEALARTLGLLPAGNRIAAKWPAVLPTECEGSKYARLRGPKPDRYWVRNIDSPKSGRSRKAKKAGAWSRVFGGSKKRKRSRKRRTGASR